MRSFRGDTRGLRAGLAHAALLALALCVLAAAPVRAAAPNWLEPADLSKPGRDASNPAVAMDGAGNTIALWGRQNVADPGIGLQISTRAAGGTFTAPVDFSRIEGDPQIAVTPAGEAVAAWRYLENPPGNHVIQVSSRPPGGGFSTPVTIAAGLSSAIPQDPKIAIGEGGDVAVTWTQVDPESEFPDFVCEVNPEPPNNEIRCPNPTFVMAAVRPDGGSFSPPTRISPLPAPKPEGLPAREEWAKEESVKSAAAGRPAVDASGNLTVAFSYFDGEHFRVESTERPAGGNFSPPVPISAAGEDAALPEIGVDAVGNAIASWQRNNGPDTIVQAATKPLGGSFAPLADVSPAGETAERPVLDVAPGGAATVVWRLPGPTESFLQSSTRPAGGAFSPPVNVSSGKDNPLFHALAISEEGDAIVVWSGNDGSEQIVRAAVRPAGAGAFGAPVAISQSTAGFVHPQPAMDAGGDATVVWVRGNGTNNIVQWAGYDADPPQFRDVSIPSRATVADSAQFSASGSDVWLVGKPSFEFGDGGHAEGDAVSHAYSAPGTYPVTVTVRDALGKTATRSAPVLVKARNQFKIGKLKRNPKKGTATLSIAIPEPGTIVASGRGIRKATVRTAKKGAVLKVRLKAVGKGLTRLRTKGKFKAKLKISYSPVGGDTRIRHHRVTLQKKLG